MAVDLEAAGSHFIGSPKGSSLFPVGIFFLTPDTLGSHPQMAQISADVFMVFTPLLVLRNRGS
jgi:hypothetical protein